MSWRRVVFAFAVTFVCALAVFTLPRFVFNSVSGAVRQTPAQDTAKARPAPPVPLQQQPAAPVQPIPRSLGSRLTGLFGIILILAIGIAFSRNRRTISWRVVAWGVGLQAVFAIFVLRIPIGQEIFSWLGATVTKILSFSYAGSEFVFGEQRAHVAPGILPRIDVMCAEIVEGQRHSLMVQLVGDEWPTAVHLAHHGGGRHPDVVVVGRAGGHPGLGSGAGAGGATRSPGAGGHR